MINYLITVFEPSGELPIKTTQGRALSPREACEIADRAREKGYSLCITRETYLEGSMAPVTRENISLGDLRRYSLEGDPQPE